MKFPKPVIFISRCLGFEKCRYDGDVINSEVVNSIAKHANVKNTCPEKEIGLGIPRDPIRIADDNGELRLFQPATGADVTKKMQSFSKKYLSNIGEVDGFILKYKSPSCGMKNVKIYLGMNSQRSRRGEGFFGSAVEKMYPGIPAEDEGRLRNISIFEHFLNRVYSIAELRELSKKKNPAKLIDFHTRNKFLLMVYSQEGMRRLGRIAADFKEMEDPISEYRSELLKTLSRYPRSTSFINAIMHGFGRISDKLSKKDRQFFLNSIEEYRDERIPLSALIFSLRSWAVHYDDEYLLNQTLFARFPPELIKSGDERFRKDYS
jgi:uncharacterized protein YbgA (DUF1722 family)/uncharacterized protein YbbK (DUF523 family)